MVYKTVIKFVLLFNAVMLTKLQVIHDSRCNNVEDDMWMKIKELQLDVLSYRKESLQLQSRLVMRCYFAQAVEYHNSNLLISGQSRRNQVSNKVRVSCLDKPAMNASNTANTYI